MRETLKQLQDTCCVLERVPDSYILRDVSMYRDKRINSGGEATIFHGSRGGSAVAVREMYPVNDGDWDSPEGRRHLKVRPSAYRWIKV